MIPVLEIVRLEENYNFGTFGILKINKAVFCVTLELPDLLNFREKSSIPAQQYRCARVDSPRFGETFEVWNVPGRSDILFHAGNTKADTKGCIILAQHWGKLKEQRAVLNSGKTFLQFMNLLKGHNILSLTITEKY